MPQRITVTCDGAHISVTVRGEGPLVILMPSLGRGAADFDGLVTRLAVAGYRAAAVDPRGAADSHGATERLTLHHYAADLACVIRHLGHPAHVVGHAFGNRVARSLAAGHPGLVSSVTLLAAGGKVPPDEEAARSLRRCFNLSLPLEERIQDVATAFFAPGNDPHVWTDGWWPDVASAESQANRATPVDDWWAAGSAPVCVIQGLHDRIAPPANGRELKERLGDRARLIELDGAGHAMLPEQPEAIARHLLDFLAVTTTAPVG
jgi:pimeloyl-ACP methyl ester carboxylesterase